MNSCQEESLPKKGVKELLLADIVIEILHRLPSKSLARFKCVCRSWERFICDSSLPYSCRSKRWNPCPSMVGFFVQPALEQAPIDFFSTETETMKHYYDDFDQSVKLFSDERSLYIVASSKGFLLCSTHRSYQQQYYVYNPLTKQCLPLPKTQIRAEHVALGFLCMIDDDVPSFTIVRHATRVYFKMLPPQSSVTIESFSSHSQTNEWNQIIVALDTPLVLYPPKRGVNFLSAAGVIDGVFYWLDAGPQITVYDSVDKCFWSLEFPEDDIFARGCDYYLGVSGGVLCYALSDNRVQFVTVWHLKSTTRSRTAVWDKKYTQHVIRAVNECPNTLGMGDPESYVLNLEFHPVQQNIVYVQLLNKVIAYNFDNYSAECVCDLGNRETCNFFRYERQQWPRLL